MEDETGGITMLQHPIIAAALVEQRQADLRGQADRWRLARSARAHRRSRRPASRRWWRPATQPQLKPQLKPEQAS
jgi:hypothetical protein